MSEARPHKPLVGKKQYKQIMGKKAVLNSEAVAVACLGVGCLAGAVCFFGMGLYNIRHPYLGPLGDGIFWCAGLAGGLGLVAAWYANTLFHEAKQIEPVELITPQNAKLLPEVETLIRGSHCPTTQDQAELLRATGQASDMPAEQLLRSAQTRNGTAI